MRRSVPQNSATILRVSLATEKESKYFVWLDRQQLERIWKEAAVAYLARYPSDETEENHEKP